MMANSWGLTPNRTPPYVEILFLHFPTGLGSAHICLRIKTLSAAQFTLASPLIRNKLNTDNLRFIVVGYRRSVITRRENDLPAILFLLVEYLVPLGSLLQPHSMTDDDFRG
jgi:hypothetical protein